MEVVSIDSQTRQISKSSSKSDANQNNFLELLVAQLRNQDPLSPVTNEDFIAQLAQLESLDEQRNIASSMKSLLNGQQFASASTLIGKEVIGVTGNEVNDTTVVGKVLSITQENGKVKVNVKSADGLVKTLELDNLQEIREESGVTNPLP